MQPKIPSCSTQVFQPFHKIQNAIFIIDSSDFYLGWVILTAISAEGNKNKNPPTSFNPFLPTGQFLASKLIILIKCLI